MAHNLVPVTLSFTARAAGDSIGGLRCPVGMTLVGITLYPGAFTGAPTSVNIDVRRNATEVLTTVASATTAGTPGTWLTPHFAGNQEAVDFERGQDCKIDLNFVGGSSPTLTGQITLFFLSGTN